MATSATTVFDAKAITTARRSGMVARAHSAALCPVRENEVPSPLPSSLPYSHCWLAAILAASSSHSTAFLCIIDRFMLRRVCCATGYQAPARRRRRWPQKLLAVFRRRQLRNALRA
eukprot:scaffold2426_cov75-Phaeocystis_antarctica.AAC.2